jgi:hypothetical protein
MGYLPRIPALASVQHNLSKAEIDSSNVRQELLFEYCGAIANAMPMQKLVGKFMAQCRENRIPTSANFSVEFNVHIAATMVEFYVRSDIRLLRRYGNHKHVITEAQVLGDRLPGLLDGDHRGLPVFKRFARKRVEQSVACLLPNRFF